MKSIKLKNNELLIDQDTKEPIKLIYQLEQKNNSLKIKVKKGVKASIIELFGADCLNEEFSREFIIEDDAKLEYLKYQNISQDSSIEINNKIELQTNSTLNMINLEFGLGSNKNNFITNLDKKNLKLNIYGLVKLDKNTKSQSIFRTTHNGENCFSNIKYKHILDDNSKATFDALSKVNETALFSKVLQNSNTILLSDDATILTRPHLEICIDELEASHGATTGSLDKEQLLYLQARGIEEKKAKKMLLKAFENDIYAKIEDLKITKFLENLKGENNV